MRKLSLLVLSLLLVSCTNSKYDPIKEYHGDTKYTKIVTLTIDKESHEFVLYSRTKWENGMAHWPSCKYCKSNEQL